MTERYENTGETQLDHSKNNKIRGLVSCYEIAVSHETFDALVSFTKARSTMSLSFDVNIEGYKELFSLYRFVSDDKTRTNIFVHTDEFDYEELITIDVFSSNTPHVNCVTIEGHSYSFYAVDDLERYDIVYLIDHILSRIVKLNNIVNDPEEKEIAEVMYDYGKMMKERYK